MFWLSIMAAGICLSCLLWLVFQPWAQSGPATSSQQNRGVLRFVWPWVRALSQVCKPFISWARRRRLGQLLSLSAWHEDWRPEHVVALQLLCFILGAVLSVWALFQYAEPGLHALLGAGVVAGGVLACLPVQHLRRRAKERQLAMLREFPFMLDMTTLCVEAGLNLQGALIQAATHGPQGALMSELRRAQTDMRAGMPRIAALKLFAARTGLAEVQQWVMAMEQADSLGMSLGPILRAQSEQRRNERFLRAEKLALQAPVKMLFPMVVCIFPCTFLVIAFPIVVKLLSADF